MCYHLFPRPLNKVATATLQWRKLKYMPLQKCQRLNTSTKELFVPGTAGNMCIRLATGFIIMWVYSILQASMHVLTCIANNIEVWKCTYKASPIVQAAGQRKKVGRVFARPGKYALA